MVFPLLMPLVVGDAIFSSSSLPLVSLSSSSLLHDFCSFKAHFQGLFTQKGRIASSSVRLANAANSMCMQYPTLLSLFLLRPPVAAVALLRGFHLQLRVKAASFHKIHMLVRTPGADGGCMSHPLRLHRLITFPSYMCVELYSNVLQCFIYLLLTASSDSQM